MMQDDDSRSLFSAACPMYSRCMWQVTLMLAGLLCAAMPALAQVTVDLHALDALPGAKPPGPEARPRRPPPKRPAASAKLNLPTSPQQPPAPEPSTSAANQAPSAQQSGTPPQVVPAPPAATLPEAAPPVIALAPVPPPPPAAQAAPPPPPPISDTATSAASAAGAGLRVT
jgi:hypothetical protein